MTLTLLWWLIPTVLSVLSLAYLILRSWAARGVTDDMEVFFLAVILIIGNLVAWLIAALLK